MEPDRGKKKVNWLLCGLIVASLVLHGVMLLYLSKGLSFKKVSCIEISMVKDGGPPARDIPRPQLPRAVPDSRSRLRPDRVHALPIPKPASPLVDQNDVKPKEQGLKKTAALDVQKAVPVKAQTVSPPQPADDAGGGARMEYLDLVRLRIEDKKQYPARALRRGFEGRVMVGFVIGTEGGIFQSEIVETSGHPLLDRAALDAVQKAAPFPPLPKKLFADRVRVRIPIIFELIRE